MLNNKLSEIARFITACNIKNIGLLSGLSGINIFSHALYDEHYELVLEKNLDSIISILNNGFSDHTYGSGISGFLWSLNYLKKYGILEKKDCDTFRQFHPYLYKRMRMDLEKNNWDLLHGAMGTGLYFLSDTTNSRSRKYVKEFIDYLAESLVVEQKGIYKWSSIVFIKGIPVEVYNFGLAHGITSIVAFLTKAYQYGISKTKSLRLLKGAIGFMLLNQNDITKHHCYFPSWTRKGTTDRQSRLGWCYGDLGIAVTLYHAAQVMGDGSLENFALKVLHHNTLRRDVKHEHVYDAGLCHGSAGIATIFYRMYCHTQDEQFKRTAAFWFEKTIGFGQHPDGLAGYKVYNSNMEGGSVIDYGILQGIAGIGLALHSWITHTEPNWDECLLLS